MNGGGGTGGGGGGSGGTRLLRSVLAAPARGGASPGSARFAPPRPAPPPPPRAAPRRPVSPGGRAVRHRGRGAARWGPQPPGPTVPAPAGDRAARTWASGRPPRARRRRSRFPRPWDWVRPDGSGRQLRGDWMVGGAAPPTAPSPTRGPSGRPPGSRPLPTSGLGAHLQGREGASGTPSTCPDPARKLAARVSPGPAPRCALRPAPAQPRPGPGGEPPALADDPPPRTLRPGEPALTCTAARASSLSV